MDREEEERRQRLMRALQAQHADAASLLSADAPPAEPGELPPGEAQQGQPRAPAARGQVQPFPPPADAQGTFVRSERKVGRNEPCPCGSGKKFKHCHGALSSVE